MKNYLLFLIVLIVIGIGAYGQDLRPPQVLIANGL